MWQDFPERGSVSKVSIWDRVYGQGGMEAEEVFTSVGDRRNEVEGTGKGLRS